MQHANSPLTPKGRHRMIALVKVRGTGFDEQTLQLTSGKETRIEYQTQAESKGHPLKSTAWSSNSKVSGDRSGEYVRTCIPVPTDEIECSGSFLLEDGDVEVDLTEEAEPSDANSDGAIIGAPEPTTVLSGRSPWIGRKTPTR